jgi:transposase InsO family protein
MPAPLGRGACRPSVPEQEVFTGRLGPHPSEVLFDRTCREQGITHRLTGIRCPTTTGKVERFHQTLRAELPTAAAAPIPAPALQPRQPRTWAPPRSPGECQPAA